MNLLNKYKNLKPLSAEERERYKRENLYNRCRKPRYFAYKQDKYPLGKFSNKVISGILNSSATTIREESGKEPVTT